MSSHAQSRIDLDYFRCRELQERDAEAASQCIYAREAHFQLAQRYADRAWSLEEANGAPYSRPTRPGLRGRSSGPFLVRCGSALKTGLRLISIKPLNLLRT